MIKRGDYISVVEKTGSEEIFRKENRLISWICFSGNLSSHMTNYNFFTIKVTSVPAFQKSASRPEKQKRAMLQLTSYVLRDAGWLSYNIRTPLVLYEMPVAVSFSLHIHSTGQHLCWSLHPFLLDENTGRRNLSKK